MISTEVKAALDNVLPLYDPHIAAALARRLDLLAKPASALGRLEDLVLHFGIARGTATPVLQRKAMYFFCGDHGVVEEGVTHEPSSAAAGRMNLVLRGGDPASVLCRRYHLEPFVLDCGVFAGPVNGAISLRSAIAASNITRLPALTADETNSGLKTGMDLATDAAARFDCAGLAHIGSGAAASCAAIISSLSGREASETAVQPPNLPESAYHRMVASVRTSCGRHSAESITPFGVLRCLGGYDLAVMTGFILGAAASRLPVIIDGYVPATAALLARAFTADSIDAALFAHQSSHPAHLLLHRLLGVEPYLELHIHPDSGCAAPLLINLLETALALATETAPASGNSDSTPGTVK